MTGQTSPNAPSGSGLDHLAGWAMEPQVFTEPQQGATYDDLLAVARTAEQLGYGAFFRSDHYLGMGTRGEPGPTDAWVTLAGLARTPRRSGSAP